MWERESALKWWEGVELMTVVELRMLEANDLRFIGRKFHN